MTITIPIVTSEQPHPLREPDNLKKINSDSPARKERVEDFLRKSQEKIGRYNKLDQAIQRHNLSSISPLRTFGRAHLAQNLRRYSLVFSQFIALQNKTIRDIETKPCSEKQLSRSQHDFDLRDKYFAPIIDKFHKNQQTPNQVISTINFFYNNYDSIKQLLESIRFSFPSLSEKLDTFYSFDDGSRYAALLHPYPCSSAFSKRMNDLYPELEFNNRDLYGELNNSDKFRKILKIRRHLRASSFFWSTRSKSQPDKFDLHIESLEQMPKMLEHWLQNRKLLQWFKDISSIELSLINSSNTIYYEIPRLLNNDNTRLNSETRIIKIRFDFHKDKKYTICYDFHPYINHHKFLSHIGQNEYDRLIDSPAMKELQKTDFLRSFLDTRFFKHIFNKFSLVGFKFDNFNVTSLQTPFLELISQKANLHPSRDFSLIFDYEKNRQKNRHSLYLKQQQTMHILAGLVRLIGETHRYTKRIMLASGAGRYDTASILSSQRNFNSNFEIPVFIQTQLDDYNIYDHQERQFTLQCLNTDTLNVTLNPPQVIPIRANKVVHDVNPIKTSLPSQQLRLKFPMRGFYPRLVSSFLNDFHEMFLSAWTQLESNRRVSSAIGRNRKSCQLTNALSYIELELGTQMKKCSESFFLQYIQENSQETTGLIRKLGIGKKEFLGMVYQEPIYENFLKDYHKKFFIEHVLSKKKLVDIIVRLKNKGSIKKSDFSDFLSKNYDRIFQTKEELIDFAIKNKELIFGDVENCEKFLKKQLSIKNFGDFDHNYFTGHTENINATPDELDETLKKESGKRLKELDDTIRIKIKNENYLREYHIQEYLSSMEDQGSGSRMKARSLAEIGSKKRFLFQRKKNYLRYIEGNQETLFPQKKVYLEYIFLKRNYFFNTKYDYLSYIKEKKAVLFHNDDEYNVYKDKIDQLPDRWHPTWLELDGSEQSKASEELDEIVRQKIQNENYLMEYYVREYLYHLDKQNSRSLREKKELLELIEYKRGFLFKTKQEHLRYLEKNKDILFSKNKDYLIYIFIKHNYFFYTNNEYIDYIQNNREKFFKKNLDEYLLYMYFLKKHLSNGDAPKSNPDSNELPYTKQLHSKKELEQLYQSIKEEIGKENVQEYLSHLETQNSELNCTKRELLEFIEYKKEFLFKTKQEHLIYLEKNRHILFSNNKDYLEYTFIKIDYFFTSINDYIAYIKQNWKKLFNNNLEEYLLYMHKFKENISQKLIPSESLYVKWFKDKIEQRRTSSPLEKDPLEKFFNYYQKEFDEFCRENKYQEHIKELAQTSTEEFILNKDAIIKFKSEEIPKKHHKKLKRALERKPKYIAELRKFAKKKTYEKILEKNTSTNHRSYDSFIRHLENSLLENNNHSNVEDQSIINLCVTNFRTQYPEHPTKEFFSYEPSTKPHNIFDNHAIRDIISSYLKEPIEETFTTYDQVVWEKAPKILQDYLNQQNIEISNNDDTKNILFLYKVIREYMFSDLRVYTGLYFFTNTSLLSLMLKLAAFYIFKKPTPKQKKIPSPKKRCYYTPFLSEVTQKKLSRPPKKNHIKKLELVP